MAYLKMGCSYILLVQWIEQNQTQTQYFLGAYNLLPTFRLVDMTPKIVTLCYEIILVHHSYMLQLVGVSDNIKLLKATVWSGSMLGDTNTSSDVAEGLAL